MILSLGGWEVFTAVRSSKLGFEDFEGSPARQELRAVWAEASVHGGVSATVSGT